MRTATHDRTEVVRITDIFQRQNAIFGIGFGDPLSHGGTVTFLNQEANAAVMFRA